MTPQEIAEVEVKLLERLKEALAGAYLGENATAEDARVFLFKTFDALRIVAQAHAGLPVTKPN